jgi:hypothetical protein
MDKPPKSPARHAFYAARSRVGVAEKKPLATLPNEARKRIFEKGPPLGFPLITRLRNEEREAHYMLNELPGLILELKKLTIPWERDPDLTLFVKTFLPQLEQARAHQMNVYALPE